MYQKDSGEYAMSSRLFERSEIPARLTPQQFMKRLKESLYRTDRASFE